MTLAYVAQLGLKVQKINVGAPKINKSLLKIYDILIAVFQIFDKLGHSHFFQETFILAKISIKVVFGIPFLILSNADV